MLLALLIVWIVSPGDDDGKKGGGSSNGSSPAPSITPGPSQSGPAISEQPGGRDESGSGEDSGKNGDTSSQGGSGGSGGDGSGTDAGTGSGSGAGSGADTGSGGSGTGADTGSGGGSSGQQVPANSPLPNCAPGSLKLTLRSEKVRYAPGDKPRLQLIAHNTSATTCKADLGPKTAVLTIKDDEADQIWSSKDCPRGSGTLLLRIPAGGSVTHTIEWDRRQSAPRCATPPAATAGPGTYLVEATVPGAKVMPASFTLTKD